jgi:Ca2+-binding EF-hand superfamily protein
VSNNYEIYSLLKQYEPPYPIEEPDLVFLNIHKSLEQPASPNSPVKLNENTVNYFKLKMKPVEQSSTKSRSLMKSTQRSKSLNENHPPSRIKVRQVHSRLAARRQTELTKEKVIELKKIFDRMDTDGNGRIDCTEFAKGLASSLEKADSMFNYFDINMAGFITFEEFLIRSFPKLSLERLTTMLKWVKERERQMRMTVNTSKIKIARSTKRKLTEGTGRDYRLIFEMYDRNKDGGLDFEELNSALCSVMTRDRVNTLFKTHGRDGQVDFKSFLTIMLPRDFEISSSLTASPTK